MSKSYEEMIDEAAELGKLNEATDGMVNHYGQSSADEQAAIIEDELLRRDFVKHEAEMFGVPASAIHGPGSPAPLTTVKELRDMGALLPGELQDDAVTLGTAKSEMAYWLSCNTKSLGLEESNGEITVSNGKVVRVLPVSGSTTFGLHGVHFVESFECRNVKT